MRNFLYRVLLVTASCTLLTCTRKHEEAQVSCETDKESAQSDGSETNPFGGITNSIGMKMVLIPAGEFIMGSPSDEKKRRDDEGPQHRVRITKPFYLGVYEVTQEQYARITNTNPSGMSLSGAYEHLVVGLKTARLPVEMVTWYDAVAFCNLLSEREGLPAYYRLAGTKRDRMTTDERQHPQSHPKGKNVICIVSATVEVLGGRGYRLPTEAEWEYACRAGTTTPFTFGTVFNGRQENCNGRYPAYGTHERGPYLCRTAAVGSYPPNAFVLYDMHGNVSEWCGDYYDRLYYATSPVDDPSGPFSGDQWERRVTRGGSWSSSPEDARSAARTWHIPGERGGGTGFRVARDYAEPSTSEQK